MLDAKIIVDSSADINEGKIGVAPLKIVTNVKEYIDDNDLDVKQMTDDLLSYNDKSSTACPSPEDWLSRFDDKPYVFCICITSGLSGSYNSALIAKADYEEKFPERKVLVIDSLSTGGEMRLIAEKIEELIAQDYGFEDIEKEIGVYTSHTALFFMLESMKNLANNGRVNSLIAKAVGLLGIRIVGKASDVGTLETLKKCRGEAKALEFIAESMLEMGYVGGKVRIAHCFNPNAAQELGNKVLAKFPKADVQIVPCKALCSFYAEPGGLILGFEK